MTQKTRGFVTILTGIYALQDCIHFLASVRNIYADPIVVLLDQVPWIVHPLLRAFGNVQLIPAPSHLNPVLASRRAKLALYDLSPFDYTLYLDSDICLLEPIDDVFKALEHRDLIVTKDVQPAIPQARNLVRNGYEILPTLQRLGFPLDDASIQYNGGFMAFSRSANVAQFFQSFCRYFGIVVRHPNELKLKDQGALAAAIATTPLNLGILPPTYNFMDKWKQAYRLDPEVSIKVLHATYPYRPQYAKDRTRTLYTRLFDQLANVCIPNQRDNPWRQQQPNLIH